MPFKSEPCGCLRWAAWHCHSPTAILILSKRTPAKQHLYWTLSGRYRLVFYISAAYQLVFGGLFPFLAIYVRDYDAINAWQVSIHVQDLALTVHFVQDLAFTVHFVHDLALKVHFTAVPWFGGYLNPEGGNLSVTYMSSSGTCWCCYLLRIGESPQYSQQSRPYTEFKRYSLLNPSSNAGYKYHKVMLF